MTYISDHHFLDFSCFKPNQCVELEQEHNNTTDLQETRLKIHFQEFEFLNECEENSIDPIKAMEKKGFSLVVAVAANSNGLT
jgi:adenine/guanine phosphoribosyltransferase-like PRPP-binding protein